jgi:hypothetical protein
MAVDEARDGEPQRLFLRASAEGENTAEEYAKERRHGQHGSVFVWRSSALFYPPLPSMTNIGRESCRGAAFQPSTPLKSANMHDTVLDTVKMLGLSWNRR